MGCSIDVTGHRDRAEGILWQGYLLRIHIPYFRGCVMYLCVLIKTCLALTLVTGVIEWLLNSEPVTGD
jgi:hypothetical protein